MSDQTLSAEVVTEMCEQIIGLRSFFTRERCEKLRDMALRSLPSPDKPVSSAVREVEEIDQRNDGELAAKVYRDKALDLAKRLDALKQTYDQLFPKMQSAEAALKRARELLRVIHVEGALPRDERIQRELERTGGGT